MDFCRMVGTQPYFAANMTSLHPLAIRDWIQYCAFPAGKTSPPVIAALTLNIFNNRCDVVGMANVEQLCNCLHSLYLASEEHFVETPNYHVFDMFKTQQGEHHIDTAVSCDLMEREGFRNMDLLSASTASYLRHHRRQQQHRAQSPARHSGPRQFSDNHEYICRFGC